MHISDALISPPVAIGAGIISLALLTGASQKIKNSSRPDIVPLMGVMGAFVFASQLLNFTIPGTGSSGHLIGGILLSAILGPWCGFITLSSILIVQCLFFADGGILALGCNIINMAATSCLLAYPLIYKPIAGKSLKPGRIVSAALASSLVALETGAILVTLETELSGITALTFGTFLKFMLSIHFVIGIVEGIVTASLLLFLASYRPQDLYSRQTRETSGNLRRQPVLWIFGFLAIIFATSFSFLASEKPDGLEWSIEKVTGISDTPSTEIPTAIMPDYNSEIAGIIGALIVMGILWGVSSLISSRLKSNREKKEV